MIDITKIPEIHQIPSLSTNDETGVTKYTNIPTNQNCNIAKYKDFIFIYGESPDCNKIKLPIGIIELFNNLLTSNNNGIDISKFEEQLKEFVIEYINSSSKLKIKELILINIENYFDTYIKNNINIEEMVVKILIDEMNSKPQSQSSINLSRLLGTEEAVNNYLKNNGIIAELADEHISAYIENGTYDVVSEKIQETISSLQIDDYFDKYIKNNNSLSSIPNQSFDDFDRKISELEKSINNNSRKEEQSLIDKITAKVKKELQVDNLISTKPNIDTVLLLKEKGLPIEDIVMLHKNGLI